MFNQPVAASVDSPSPSVEDILAQAHGASVNVGDDSLRKTAPFAEPELMTQMSVEEHQVVLSKLKEFVRQPAGHLAKQDELYLEQQLTDVLGVEVSAELDQVRLPYSIGVMQAATHLRRYPTDVLVHHKECLEAGIRNQRGFFGWFTDMGQLTEQAVEKEQYYIGVPAQLISAESRSPQQLKEWFKFRKVVVLNPLQERGITAVIGDCGPAGSFAQFTGSPEIMRHGQIWSPAAQGHVMVLFVNDPMNKLPLGPFSLSYDYH